VLLEETFGDTTDHGTDHHDLVTFEATASALRDNHALRVGGRLVAVHLSHHNPPHDQLSRHLAAVGAEVLADGTRLSTAPSPTPSRATRTLLLGGARSGKSTLAEQLIGDHDRVTYVATAATNDAEMTERVDLHRARRPGHWQTIETADVESVLDAADEGDVLLVDCLTLWLARALDDADTWQTGDTSTVRKRIDALADAWRDTKATVVGVSNEVGSGVVPATVSGRVFRDLQGTLNASVSAVSDEVRLVVAGRSIRLHDHEKKDT